jgi:simple sugar transport system ATP-binding protein
MTSLESEFVLQAKGIFKSFGAVEALRGVDFNLRRGEVVALMGDNGAGKSTLTKVLSGAIKPDTGSILLNGDEVVFDSPIAARSAGIETVFQDLSLADSLDPVANLYLGREIFRTDFLGKLGFIDKKKMRNNAFETFAKLNLTITSGHEAVGNLSGGQRQGIAVCRAVTWAKHVLFLDEPTAALGLKQTQNVLDLIRKVRDSGVSVVLISHSLPEVLEVADRIEVLRLGQRVGTFETQNTNSDEIIGAITGSVSTKGRNNN